MKRAHAQEAWCTRLPSLQVGWNEALAHDGLQNLREHALVVVHCVFLHVVVVVKVGIAPWFLQRADVPRLPHKPPPPPQHKLEQASVKHAKECHHDVIWAASQSALPHVHAESLRARGA